MGKEAIDTLAKKDPKGFLSIIVQLMPKDININDNTESFWDQFTEDEASAILVAFREFAAGNDGSSGVSGEGEAPEELSSVH